MINNKCLYNSNIFNFNNLPDDIYIYIINFLNIKEICTLSCSNKEINNVTEYNSIWLYYIKKYNVNLSNYDVKYNYKYIISSIIGNIQQSINDRKKENNERLIYITSNIYRFNYIIKQIYNQNRYKKQKCQFNNELTLFISKLLPYINNNILTSNIYINTLDYYNKYNNLLLVQN
jgi:hypothetical protein